MASTTIKVKIEDVPPFDGEYELDLSYFTNRELHLIKKLTGLRGGEVQEAIDTDDNDLAVAFAVIGMQRAGRPVPKAAIEVLWDANVGAITFTDVDDEADDETAKAGDERPPDSPTPSGSESEPSGVSSESSSEATSGPDS